MYEQPWEDEVASRRVRGRSSKGNTLGSNNNFAKAHAREVGEKAL